MLILCLDYLGFIAKNHFTNGSNETINDFFPSMIEVK